MPLKRRKRVPMSYLDNFMELAASVTECLIVVRLCNECLTMKSQKLRWLKSASYFALLLATNLLFGQRMPNLAFILLFLISGGYVLLFCEGRLYEKLLIVLFPVITILPINLLLMNLFRVWSGFYDKEVILLGGALRYPLLVFSKLMFFFVCEMLIHVRRKGRYQLDGIQWLIQFSCLMITYMISWFLWHISVNEHEMVSLVGVNLLIVALNILCYLIMGKMHRDSMVKEEYRVLKINLAAQERFVDEARERYTQMRTLRHDMRHYLTTAAELLSEERTGEAKEYIETLLKEKIDRAAPGVDTGNVVIDSVVNNRIAICAKRGIRVKCMIDSQFGSVSDMDLSIVLSNALDNAMNGCEGVKQPEISLTIGSRKAFTQVVVKNTIAESVLSRNPKLETDKEDKAVHGFGIASMQKIAEKYCGSLEFREEDNGSVFVAEIWL